MLQSESAGSMGAPVLVEAAVESLDAALAAESAGADRIELCANLDVGGTTPTVSLLEDLLQRVRLPVHVMVRPRGGDFIFTDDEVGRMAKDIELIRSHEPAGIVTGVVGSNGLLPMSDLSRLVDAASELPVTFHRAFDSLLHPHAALEQLIDLGVARILTSGEGVTASKGAAKIGALVEQARGRITIIAGGGVRAHNVREIIRNTGVTEVHARFVDEQQMRDLIAAVRG